jgi:hypothetical protein
MPHRINKLVLQQNLWVVLPLHKGNGWIFEAWLGRSMDGNENAAVAV